MFEDLYVNRFLNVKMLRYTLCSRIELLYGMSVHVIIGSKFDDDDDVVDMVLCMLYIKCLTYIVNCNLFLFPRQEKC